MRYIQLMPPVSGRQSLWFLLAFFLTLGIGENMAMAAAPGNDNFSAATAISEATGAIAGSTIDATAESGEPAHMPPDPDYPEFPPDPAHHSIWYQWTAPSSTSISFDTMGSDFDTVLAVYTGTAVNALTTVARNDDSDDGGTLTSKVIFTPSAGTTYYIAIDGYGYDEFTYEFGATVLNWVTGPRTLIVKKTGSGTGVVTGGGTYADGTTQQITATADSGSTFIGWSGDCTGTDSPLDVLMDADKTCTASFILDTDTRLLTVNMTGSGAGVVAGGGTYLYGTTQQISATANVGSTFIGWSGDCTGTTSPLDVLISADKTCTASFVLDTDTFDLTITKTGTGSGTVTGDGTYLNGTTQQITAAADSGSTFTGWSGDCTGTASPLEVLMDANKMCIATFTLNTHALTINKTGSGTVTSAPAGISCGDDCSEDFGIGNQIILTATPDANNTFVGWSGGSCSGTQDCTVMMDGNITITATFKKNFPWPMFMPAITGKAP